MEPLCKVTLKKDPAYAIKKMTKILKVLKDRHTNDLKWYSRYHSSTRKFRKLYEKKLEKQFLSLTRAKASVNIGVNETIGGQ
jgi:reverse gyrase